jgi:hypothetical protein
MIVQQSTDAARCGVIRDLIRLTDTAKNFEFRCFDQHAPNTVVIGTAVRRESIRLTTAIDAWKIDLKELKFVATHEKAVCSPDGLAGEDGGDNGDMVDEAKSYAAHGKPGQFPREYR